MSIVVGITGASGVQYAFRLLEVLGNSASVVISKDGMKVIEAEMEVSPKDFFSMAGTSHADDDFNAPFASGSSPFEALVVVPCSMNTLAKISLGLSDTLITRTASVALKEGRKLILVPRETPLHRVQLEHMLKAAELGATVLPAMPGFYHRPSRVEDLVDFVVARILDQLGVKQDLVPTWGGPPKPFTGRQD